MVLITIVRPLCLSNQSRQCDDEGDVKPTNATGAQLALGVDMLSGVGRVYRAPKLPSFPSRCGKRARADAAAPFVHHNSP